MSADKQTTQIADDANTSLLSNIKEMLDATYSASSDEEVERIIAANPEKIATASRRARKVARAGLPFYASVVEAVRENKYVDKGIMMKDAVLTGVAGWVAWRGVKLAWTFVRGG